MGFQQTVGPVLEPVSLADAKEHLGVFHPASDGRITALIMAARQFVEEWTGRQLITATWKLTLDTFPAGIIRLPKPPLITVSSVKYYDQDGVLQTLATSVYQADSSDEPARFGLQSGEAWPSIEDGRYGAVEITYTAGYGAAASSVPPAIVHAVKLLIGHWNENREAVSTGSVSTEIALALKSILWLYYSPPFEVD